MKIRAQLKWMILNNPADVPRPSIIKLHWNLHRHFGGVGVLWTSTHSPDGLDNSVTLLTYLIRSLYSFVTINLFSGRPQEKSQKSSFALLGTFGTYILCHKKLEMLKSITFPLKQCMIKLRKEKHFISLPLSSKYHKLLKFRSDYAIRTCLIMHPNYRNKSLKIVRTWSRSVGATLGQLFTMPSACCLPTWRATVATANQRCTPCSNMPDVARIALITRLTPGLISHNHCMHQIFQPLGLPPRFHQQMSQRPTAPYLKVRFLRIFKM